MKRFEDELKRFSITQFRVFRLIAVASDEGTPEPQSSMTGLTIEVIEPNRKPPRFIHNFEPVKYLKEGFGQSGNRSSPIFEIEARYSHPTLCTNIALWLPYWLWLPYSLHVKS